MLNELREDDLLLNRYGFAVADEGSELLGIVEEIVVPRVFVKPQFFSLEVLGRRTVYGVKQHSEGAAAVRLQEWRLPVIVQELRHFQAQLRHEALC